MKKFRQLVRETRVEDEGLPSEAARTYKEKPNKEPMPKLKEENDTTEKEEMAQTQLHFIKYAAEEILEFIDMDGEIEEWYQNKLSKVHSDMEGLHSYIEGEKRRTGMVKEEQLDELSPDTLNSYMQKRTSQISKRVNAAMDKIEGKPSKHDVYNKGLKTAGVKYEKERKKQTGMNPQQPRRAPPPLYPLDGRDPDSGRSYSEEYESVPASKALQKAHEDERKRRGLPDPDYYLKLRDQKRKEIEDMKKEETEIDEKISVVPAGTPNTGIQRIKTPSGGTITTGTMAVRRKPESFLDKIKNKKNYIRKEEVKQPTGGLKDVCWKGYTAVGMKMKNGRKVPNCVPKEEVEIEEGYYKNQEIERQETERLAKQPPFTPDKPKKRVVVGKKPEGYSTARHLARQAMQKYTKPVKESLEESRRAEIVKEIIKKKKNEDKFNAEPIISDTVTRNN